MYTTADGVVVKQKTRRSDIATSSTSPTIPMSSGAIMLKVRIRKLKQKGIPHKAKAEQSHKQGNQKQDGKQTKSKKFTPSVKAISE